ncbi:hypothetical protein PWP93_30590 [Paraburkholderia sp. A1RI-2L]|uniref:hypothetical protein n=1 Tax=Paraburkholderia sp. A1RI-2L TaxID=3028367 RepID=UPI003B811344
MPTFGLGIWPMLGDECTHAVKQALDRSYRHIDTATAYNNDRSFIVRMPKNMRLASPAFASQA